MTTISITVDDRVVLSILARARVLLGDMRPLLKDVGAGLVSNIKQNLGRGMTPWGNAMKPLKYRRGVPLNDTRQHIYNRITHRLVGSNAVEVGMLDSATAKIGRVHQYGATILPKQGKYLRFQTHDGAWHTLRQAVIPARPFLPIHAGRVDLPATWRDEILDQIREHLAKAMRP